jgi:hypothetical protein
MLEEYKQSRTSRGEVYVNCALVRISMMVTVEIQWSSKWSVSFERVDVEAESNGVPKDRRAIIWRQTW